MKKLITVFSIFITLASFGMLAAQIPTISTCQGTSTQTFCVSGNTFTLCVQINVEPTFTDPIDRFEIKWDDGTTNLVVPGSSNPPEYTHDFDLSGFFGTCTTEKKYYISLITHKSGGGSEENIFPLTLKNPPTAKLSANSPVCIGQSSSLNDNSCPTNGLLTNPWNYGDGTTGMDNIHVYNQTGTFIVKRVVENECGIDEGQITVEVIDEPVAKIENLEGLLSGEKLCLGQIFSLTGINSLNVAPSSYQWSITPNATFLTPKNGEDTVRIQFAQTGIYEITMKVDNDCNAPDEATFTVEVVDALALVLNQQSDLCLSVNYSPDTIIPNAQYFLNGTMISTSDFPVFIDVIGTYYVEARLNNLCGNQIVRDTFLVIPPISADILFPTNAITMCLGDNPVGIQVEQAGGVWSGGTLTGSGVSYSFSPIAAGNYQLIYATGSGGNCERRDTLRVIVNENSDFLSDISFCEGTTPFVLQSSLGKYESFTCADCPTCLQDSLFIPDNMTTDSVQIIYESQNSSGCAGGSTAMIYRLTPSPVLIIPDTICFGEALIPNTTATIADEIIFLLDGMPAQAPFTGLSEGLHTLELIAQVGACEESVERVFIVRENFSTISFTADLITGYSPLSVSVSPSGDPVSEINYFWTSSANSDTIFGFSAQSFNFINDSDTIEKHTITFHGGGVCEYLTHTIEIEVIPCPRARLGVDSTYWYCSPAVVTFSNRATGTPDSFAILIDGIQHSSSYFDTLRLEFTAQDTIRKYVVAFAIGSPCGMSYDTVIIEVIPPVVKALFNAPKFDYCAHDTIRLVDASTPKPTSWRWIFPDGTYSTEPNPLWVSGLNDTIVSVRLIVGYGDCSFSEIEHVFTFYPSPDADFSAPITVCSGEIVELQNLAPSQLNEYHWDYGDGTFDDNRIDGYHSYLEGGSYVIKMTATDVRGCENMVSTIITVVTTPTAEFIALDLATGENLLAANICKGDSIGMLNSSSNATSYRWLVLNEGTTAGNSTLASPNFSFNTGLHDIRLIASNMGFCFDTLIRLNMVEVDDCHVYIPNIIKPDGSYANAFFTAFTGNNRTVRFMKIFDRWGNLVFDNMNFQTNTPDEGWDGEFKGRPVKPDIYLYQLQLDNPIEFKKGEFVIIR